MISLFLPKAGPIEDKECDLLVKRVNLETKYFLNLEKRVSLLFQQMRDVKSGDGPSALSARIRQVVREEGPLYKVTQEAKRVLERMDDHLQRLIGRPVHTSEMLHPEAWLLMQRRLNEGEGIRSDLQARLESWERITKELKAFIPQEINFPLNLTQSSNGAEVAIALLLPLGEISDRFEKMERFCRETPEVFTQQEVMLIQKETLENCAARLENVADLLRSNDEKRAKGMLLTLILEKSRSLHPALSAEVMKRVLPKIGLQVLKKHPKSVPLIRSVARARLYALPPEELGSCIQDLYPPLEERIASEPPSNLTIEKEYAMGSKRWEKIANRWKCCVHVISPYDANLHVTEEGSLQPGEGFTFGSEDAGLTVRIFWDGKNHFPITPQRGH